jgi:pimeloyl-ACP methyl ester carboxylesterase
VDLPMESARLNGVDLAYSVRGQGRPLLLIHGTGVPASTWPAEWIDRLAGSVQVIMFDYRGTGSTPATPETLSTRLLAADVAALLQHLDAYPADILGHSMGGRVAQWLALDNPHLVRSLVLDSTGPGEFGGEFPVTRGLPLRVAVETAEMGMLGHFKHETAEVGFTPDYLDGRARGFHEFVEAFAANPTSIENYFRLTIARQLHQTAGLLRDITVPTLVTVGDHETTTGGTGSHVDQAKYLARMIPNSELRILENLAHYHFWQDPKGTSDLVLGWLDAPLAGT